MFIYSRETKEEVEEVVEENSMVAFKMYSLCCCL